MKKQTREVIMIKKYTILIIDDKVENLKYLNEILKEENYKIKAMVMADGETVAAGTPDEIRHDPIVHKIYLGEAG